MNFQRSSEVGRGEEDGGKFTAERIEQRDLVVYPTKPKRSE
jgi:hypothetical protein